MASLSRSAFLLGINADDVEERIRTRQLVAVGAPGEAWRLPVWQFTEPLLSVMPGILAGLDLDGWAALSWLEAPLGGLRGLAPRTAVERGLGARVLQLAQAEGV